MNIAFISIVRDPWGGSEELWAKAAELALESGHSVVISAFNRPDISPKFLLLKSKGATLLLRRGYIKAGTGLYKRVAQKALNFLLNKISNPYTDLFKLNPDVIIYTGACYSIADDPDLLNFLFKHETPFLINNQVNIEYSKPINESEASIIRKAYQHAIRVLFVSERNIRTAQRHLLSKIENQEIIRNTVNLSDTSLIEFPSDNSTVKFAMVANLLVNHKGHDILLDILRSPKWQNRSWILNIYGSGNDENYITNLITFYNLGDRVKLCGRTNDIRKVWEENHVLLLPSLNEGIPLALVEAMICGRPVIVTDVGGNSEWIIDNENGYIAEGANILSFDRAMERGWSDMQNWPTMGKKAHERAMSLYDPQAGATFLNLILKHGRRP
jgi:glycosyltransferase involved in cell wall biosynthesis